MNRTKERTYHPLCFVSTLEGHLDNLLEALENQWKLFVFARDNPETIDEDTIKNAQELLKKNPEDIRSIRNNWLSGCGKRRESPNKRNLG